MFFPVYWTRDSPALLQGQKKNGILHADTFKAMCPTPQLMFDLHFGSAKLSTRQPRHPMCRPKLTIRAPKHSTASERSLAAVGVSCRKLAPKILHTAKIPHSMKTRELHTPVPCNLVKRRTLSRKVPHLSRTPCFAKPYFMTPG
jgi:hypothetical protein